MKRLFQKKSIIQKIAIVLLITLLCYCIIPTYSLGFSLSELGGDLLKVLLQLLVGIGDAVMGAFNKFMLGTDKMIGSVMLSRDDPTVEQAEGALHADDNALPDLILGQDKDASGTGNEDDANEEKLTAIFGGDDWEIPNMLYSPEAIFSNSVAALDVNFLNPNTYTAVQEGDGATKAARSSADFLKETISSWYVGFRNIAIVALLTVLVFLGIKIVLGSVDEKAKYKESLRDWVVALCLVFIIHFIMSGILMITQKVTELFDNSARDIVVQVADDRASAQSALDSGDGSNATSIEGDGNGIKFSVSLIGLARLRVQSANAGVATAYFLIYFTLIFYTIMFTVIYLKRFLYMAFLTMIAPLVAITYPIDKIGDGTAQAFTMWFREYTMNAILQPLHLILYTALVSSSVSLVVQNPFYALVAIAFLIPAEKFVKSMFGFNKAETPGTLGGLGTAALAMSMTGIKGVLGRRGSGGSSSSNNKIRTSDEGNEQYISDSGSSGISSSTLSTYNSGSSDNNLPGGGAPVNSDTDNPNGPQPGPGGGFDSDNPSQDAYQDDMDSQDVGFYSANSLNGDTTYDGNDYESSNIPGGMAVLGANINGNGDSVNPDENLQGENNPEVSNNRARLFNNGDENNPAVSNNRARLFTNGTDTQNNGEATRNTRGNRANPQGQQPQRLNMGRKPKSAPAAMGAMMIRGAKTAGKKVWKNKKPIVRTFMRGVGGVSGALLSVPYALSQGDASKVVTGFITGVGIGGVIGGSAVNVASNVASKTVDKVKNQGNKLQDAWNEERFGIAEASRMRQEREDEANRKKFMKDEKQKRQAKMVQEQLAMQGHDVSLDSIMNSRYDYVKAGIKDDDIRRAQIAEVKNGINGATHNDYVDLAKQADKYGINAATFSDTKKYNEFADTLSAEFGSEEKAMLGMGIMSEIKGQEKAHLRQAQNRMLNNQTSRQQSRSQNRPRSLGAGVQSSQGAGQTPASEIEEIAEQESVGTTGVQGNVRGTGAHRDMGEIGAGAQGNIRGTGAGAHRDVGEIGAGAQGNIRETGARAQGNIRETGVGAQGNIREIRTEIQGNSGAGAQGNIGATGTGTQENVREIRTERQETPGAGAGNTVVIVGSGGRRKCISWFRSQQERN